MSDSRPVDTPDAGWGWLLQARAGHEASARRLVRELTPQAWRMARQMTGRAEEADEVVQEAFLRLWKSHAHDTGQARLQTYFNTLVINVARTRLGRQVDTPTDDAVLLPLVDEQHAQSTPSSSLEQQQDRMAMRRALDQLPPRQRLALSLWAYQDASVHDIARDLDLAPNAVHQLLHRARQALRRLLQPAAPSGDTP